MYWFLYKKFTSHRGIVYNGDTTNLKHTIDPIEAQKWFDKTKESFKSVKVKRLDSYINLNFPLVTEWEEDLWIGEYINKSNVSLSTQQFMHQFLNQFIFTKDWFFKERFKWVSEDHNKLWILLSMRNMIEWLIRWKPIKVEVWLDKKTNKAKYSNWYIHQNFWSEDIPTWEEESEWCHIRKKFKLETKDWEVEVPIMWAYAQKLLATVFPRPQYSWRRLQIWQQRFLLERWLYTVVLAPRWGWKSVIAAFLAFTYLMRQFTDFDDEIKKNTIHYFWLDEKQLDTVGNYVVWMVSKMIDNKKAIKYLKTDMEVVLNDWWDPARIKLMSAIWNSLGRWERPSLVIIDEAWYTNEEIYKIAKGNSGIPIVMITTVNPSTRRNWAYEMALDWLAQQRSYESIEDTIVRIFFKYWLDKVTTVEQLEEMYEKRVFRDMKDELHYSRPLVTLKFTIDDRENITPQAKELMLIEARRSGEKFLAAEHYSEYVEELTLFNSDWLYEQDLPEKYDVWYVWYDPAYKYDNPALCLWWYKNWLLYIEESVILPSDPVERTKKIKSMTELFRQKCKRVITLMDTTQDEEQYETMETRWYVIDVPCKWTNWWWINYSWRVHLVGKKVLVNDVSKEVFFDRSIIRFSSKLIWEKSLSEELQYYTLLKSGKYWASQWKDDQVSAMMMVCYGCYIDTMKWELSSERYLWYDPEQLEMIKEQERLNELYYEDYSNNRENAIVNGLL